VARGVYFEETAGEQSYHYGETCTGFD
jgi:hypothetical protein